MAKKTGVNLVEREGYLEATLTPTSSADLIKRQFEELLQLCKEKKPLRLLVDMTPLTGKFTTLERYDLGMIGSRFVTHVSRVAVLVTPDLLDPEKFGVMVARNRGLTLEIFVDRPAAVAWLTTP